MSVEDQSRRLEALLAPPPGTALLVSPTSRYAGVGTAVYDPAGERPVAYLRRRFVPRPERLATIGAHVVTAGERTDQIAAAALGDPELFWRLCDGNRAVFPDELVREAGRWLRVTAPEAPGAAP